MRYRTLSPSGDFVFGAGMGEFLENSPQCVAQAVMTRLLLTQGEWFLDITEGTPYQTQVLGTGTQNLYDAAIRARILGTPNVVSIDSYASTLNPDTRGLQIACTITTAYGKVAISGPQQIKGVPPPGVPGRLDFTFVLGSSALG